MPEPPAKDGIVGDHVARDVSQYSSPEPDDPHVAGHEPGQDAAPPDDERQRQADAEDHEDQVAVGRRGDGEDIVEAHRDVGEDDDPDGLSERGTAPHELPRFRARTHQLDGDPDQQEPAREPDEGDGEQGAHEGDSDEAQEDRGGGAPDPRLELTAPGQRAHGEGDDEGIVAGEGQVDDDDAEQASPELGVGEDAHAGSPRRADTLNQRPRRVRTPASASGNGYSRAGPSQPSQPATIGSSSIMSPATYPRTPPPTHTIHA